MIKRHMGDGFMTRRRAGLLITALVGALTVFPATSTAAPPLPAAATASGFVARTGSQLTLSGQPWNFAGYNLPCQQPFSMTTQQLEYYFRDIALNSKANVVRMWWFQSEMGTGPNPWAPFDQTVAAAKAVGVRIVAALTNQWQTCDEPSPATPEKELPWYQGGYAQPEGGYALSYKQFAIGLATHFANEPTIAFWQLVNEAEAPSSSGCNENSAALALRAFADDMATSLRSVDPQHLLNLGTQGAGECGTAGSDYSYVHAGAVDLCEVHDYSDPALAMPTGTNSLGADISACHALGKPIFIGEAGIPADVQTDGSSGSAPISTATLVQRAQFFHAKIDTFHAAGGVGYVIWFKSPFYTLTENNLDVPDGDPTESVLSGAIAAPPAATPEFPSPVIALVWGSALAGAFLFARKRRSRCGPPET
jgi:hypothetical protein